jgi:hypothetical protein
MPWSVRIATALLLALGVVLIVAGRVTVGVADLLVVGVPTWALATVRGLRTLRGDEPMRIPGDPITPTGASRLDQWVGGGGHHGAGHHGGHHGGGDGGFFGGDGGFFGGGGDAGGGGGGDGGGGGGG